GGVADGPRIHPAHASADNGVSRSRVGGLAVGVRSRRGARQRRRMTIELPGFFDLQVNGFAGIDFNAADLASDAVAQALDRMRATGVTRCLPTLITSSLDRFAAAARVIAATPDATIAGIHMEGPYLSRDAGARGAHRPGDLRDADVDDFKRRQDA